MDACAFIVYAPCVQSGALVELVTPTVMSIREAAIKAELPTDIYVYSDGRQIMGLMQLRQWLTGLYVGEGRTGYPVGVNVILDEILSQRQEGGRGYEAIGLLEAGAACSTESWLGDAVGIVDEGQGEWAFGLVGEVKGPMMDIGSGRLATSHFGVGAFAKRQAIEAWRAQPYAPVYDPLLSDLAFFVQRALGMAIVAQKGHVVVDKRRIHPVEDISIGAGGLTPEVVA